MSGEKVYRRFRAVLGLAFLIAGTACGGGSPTSPTSPPRVGYAGEWSGVSLQGDSLTFTVSNEQKVTAIAFDYRLNGCSGRKTFSGLSADIVSAPGVKAFFRHDSSDADARNYVSIQGFFDSAESAGGVTGFSLVSCGEGLGVWSARRR
jgi:hypothetical protein